MSKYSQLQSILMLQSMQCDDSLQRGLITIVAKRFNMACSTVYQLWEQAVCMCAMGDIFLWKLIPRKKLREASYISERVHSGGCQRCSTVEEAYPKKTCDIDGGIKEQLCIDGLLFQPFVFILTHSSLF